MTNKKEKQINFFLSEVENAVDALFV